MVKFFKAAVVVAVGISSLAMADMRKEGESKSKSFEIEGQIPEVLELSVRPTKDSKNLNLRKGNRTVKVAEFNVADNSGEGLTIAVKGDKTKLTSERNAKFAIPYTISPAAPLVIAPSNDLLKQKGDIAISFQGKDADDMLAGGYQDTITVTVTAK